MASQPIQPPSKAAPPAHPADTPAPPASEADAPPKFKRPLPQPGDKDYVAGQPTSEEEAAKVEKEEADRHAAAKAAREKEQADKRAADAAHSDKKP